MMKFNKIRGCVLIISLLIIRISHLNAQSNRDFDYTSFLSDTIIVAGGEYYTIKTFPTGLTLHWYGSFYVDSLSEKKCIGVHLLFYPKNLTENNIRIKNVDTTRVGEIHYYDKWGNFEKSVRLNYTNREIQSIYFPPPKENEERNDEFSILLLDTLLFENGDYYYTAEKKRYLGSKKHKYYGRFIRKGRKKIPVGKHLKFYYEESNDEYGKDIGIPDTFRVQRIDYYDENGNFEKSVAIYYTSRKIQYIAFSLFNNDEKNID